MHIVLFFLQCTCICSLLGKCDKYIIAIGACILVHGTDGTDSSLLVTSLAQVILNPDSRTIRGMQSLIEREWIQSGHPFATRCQHGAYSGSQKRNQAPTFLLLLDCVWQVSREIVICVYVMNTLLQPLYIFFFFQFFFSFCRFLNNFLALLNSMSSS